MAKANKTQPAPDYTYAILTEGLWRVYKVGADIEVPALRGLDLKIESARFVALKGRSGSGKTTLLNCLSGLDRPTSGTAVVLGNVSAYENVELMLRIKGAGGRARHERTAYCLELVGLTKWMDHRPYELSGGQQQRVAIARALANSPQLILADEPTGELDSETAREILGLFLRIVREEQMTVLMASHDSLVDEYVDTILQLRDGQITERIDRQ